MEVAEMTKEQLEETVETLQKENDELKKTNESHVQSIIALKTLIMEYINKI